MTRLPRWLRALCAPIRFCLGPDAVWGCGCPCHREPGFEGYVRWLCSDVEKYAELYDDAAIHGLVACRACESSHITDAGRIACHKCAEWNQWKQQGYRMNAVLDRPDMPAMFRGVDDYNNRSNNI